MKQTITKTVTIIPMDNKFNIYYSKRAPYQLEVYYTEKKPTKCVGILNSNSRKFSHKVGDIIDVSTKVNINSHCYLTNVVINKFLQNYLNNR
ncbi:MAG: hypothetical protein KBS86_00170 [Proteobacteria bacterium]|nr:hypothetical protein [Candidatus Enterousia scatequi]